MHPYTPEGRQLLAIFEGLIRNYGGAERLASDIEAEWAKSNIDSRYVFYTKDEIRFLKRNYKTLSYEQISHRLNKTIPSIKHKLCQLYDERLPRKYNLKKI